MYKREFIGKTPDYSPNSPKLKIGGKNYARNHFAQPDEHRLGYADFSVCLPFQCILFSVLQHQSPAGTVQQGKADKLRLEDHRFCLRSDPQVHIDLSKVKIEPLFADMVGWEIPTEYVDIFSNLVIIGAVLMVSCKYIAEAFTKFKAILDATKEDKSNDEIK